MMIFLVKFVLRSQLFQIIRLRVRVTENMQYTEYSPFYDGPEVVLHTGPIGRNSKVTFLTEFGDKLAIIN